MSIDILDKAYRNDDLLMLHCIFADARRVVRRGGCLVLTDTGLGEIACTTEADIGLLDAAYASESLSPRVGTCSSTSQ